VLIAAIEGAGVATSMILSANRAMSSRFPVSGVEARTILRFDGRRCRKSLRIEKHHLCSAPYLPVVVACGVEVAMVSCPPALNNCCSRFFSDAAARFINCSFILSYGVSSGGCRTR